MRKSNSLKLLLSVLLLAIGCNVWGETTKHAMKSYSNKVITDDQSKTWTISATGTSLSLAASNELPCNFASTGTVKRGVSIAKAEAAIKITSGASFSDVTKVVVYASANGSTTGTVSVKVGSTTMTAPASATIASGDKNKSFEFTSSTKLTGVIEITLPYTTTKTVWFGGVEITTGAIIAVTGVALDKKTISIQEGEVETLIATVNPTDATNKKVTWTSDDESVARVKDGVVSAVGPGKTNVTVTTVDGNKSDVCEVTVTAMPRPDLTKLCTLTFVESESATNDGGTKYGTTDLSQIFSTDVDFVSGVSNLSNTYPARIGRGAKLGTSSNTGKFTITLANNVKARSVVLSAAGYADGEVNAFVVNNVSKTPTKYASQGFEDLEFIFVSASNTINIATDALRGYIKTITIYVEGVDVTVAEAGYATYFNADNAVELPTGVEGYVWEDGLVKVYDAATTEKVVPAGEPVVLKAAAGTYSLKYTTTETPSYKEIDSNDLQGAATAMTAAEMAEANPDMGKFYALSLNAAGEASSVGFYWVENEGAAFDITAGKAYLALPAGPGAPARFVFGQQDVPTEVVNVNDNNQSTKVLRDGRLYIVRDGNMFDLNGRLVK